MAHLNEEQKCQLKNVLDKYSNMISDTPGCVSHVTHKIVLKPNVAPVSHHPYRLSPENQAKLRKEVDELLKLHMIEPSHSEWSSPAIIVPKPNGSIRFVIDYRKVNNLIEGNSFPIPRIDDLIDRIGKGKFLTKMNLSKGFYQIPLDENSKFITTFCTSFGSYNWKRLPFGLKISPSVFSSMISSVLEGLEDICGVYIDDIVTFSENWDDHIKHCCIVFDRLLKAKLTVKLAKCSFACKEIEYLGHVVGLGKIMPMELKVKSLMETSRPQTKKQLQSFLGLAGFYQRYLPLYSQMTAPLAELLKKSHKYVWTEKKDKAFCEIKKFMSMSPVLKIANFNKPFVIFVDASDIAVGSVLMQKDDNDNKYKPVCYFSNKLNKCQALILSI